MRVKRIQLTFPTRDVAGTLRFYVSKLSFKRVWDFPEYCTVSFERLHLSFAHSSKNQLLRAFQTDQVLISFDVQGIRGYFEEFKARGITFVQPIELMQPGVWHFSFRDNNGYLIGFSEHR